MKALCWYGKHDVRVETVPDPQILNPRDAIVRVTSTAICGSDLHLYNNFIPGLSKGDILGHEFMGEVVEVGSSVNNLNAGDRVVVPFTISCGSCFFCERQEYSLCDNSNPNAVWAEKMWGYSTAGFYGYSHMTGGYAGGQAEYVRVPFADVGPMKVSNGFTDEQVLLLTDVFPTAYQAAEFCGIQPGDTIAIWGCGPIGQLTIASARMMGAERIIAIDRVPERLDMAARQDGVETINYEDIGGTVDIVDYLREITGGMGPDGCIDAVGMEGHGVGLEGWYDWTKQKTMMETGRPTALRQAILACRKGGTVSIPGVYGGIVDKIPMGSAMNKALVMRMGQTHVQRYLRPLIERIENGEIDPSFIITHRMRLDDAPKGYEIFRKKEDNCIKVVLKP